MSSIKEPLTYCIKWTSCCAPLASQSTRTSLLGLSLVSVSTSSTVNVRLRSRSALRRGWHHFSLVSHVAAPWVWQLLPLFMIIAISETFILRGAVYLSEERAIRKSCTQPGRNTRPTNVYHSEEYRPSIETWMMLHALLFMATEYSQMPSSMSLKEGLVVATAQE